MKNNDFTVNYVIRTQFKLFKHFPKSNKNKTMKHTTEKTC